MSTELPKYLHLQGRMATVRLIEDRATIQGNTICSTDRKDDYLRYLSSFRKATEI